MATSNNTVVQSLIALGNNCQKYYFENTVCDIPPHSVKFLQLVEHYWNYFGTYFVLSRRALDDKIITTLNSFYGKYEAFARRCQFSTE